MDRFFVCFSDFWYDGLVFQSICSTVKTRRTIKNRNYAQAVQLLGSDEIFSSKVQEYLVGITAANKTLPVILVDEEDELILVSNISEEIQNDSKKLEKIVSKMKQLHAPIEVDLGELGKQYVYYENSQLLKRLQCYPMILILIIILFAYFSYWYFKTLKNTEQSFLWAGMAKETAHQIRSEERRVGK